MTKFPDYTDKLDYPCCCTYTTLCRAGRIDFSGGDMYTGLARKLGLIDRSDNAYTKDGQHNPDR